MSNHVSVTEMASALDEEWRPFNCLFSVTEGNLENRVGDQKIRRPGRPASSGLQVPGEPGHFRARRRHFVQEEALHVPRSLYSDGTFPVFSCKLKHIPLPDTCYT